MCRHRSEINTNKFPTVYQHFYQQDHLTNNVNMMNVFDKNRRRIRSHGLRHYISPKMNDLFINDFLPFIINLLDSLYYNSFTKQVLTLLSLNVPHHSTDLWPSFWILVLTDSFKNDYFFHYLLSTRYRCKYFAYTLHRKNVSNEFPPYFMKTDLFYASVLLSSFVLTFLWLPGPCSLSLM